MRPRYFRATAILCLAILVADAVVAQLPHQHFHHNAGHDGSTASCSHQHAHSGCTHACSHHQGCNHVAPVNESKPEKPTDSSQPCDHCTLCRHQAQAALPCTVVPVPVFLATCELFSDEQTAQVSSITPHVYQGRGPPAVL